MGEFRRIRRELAYQGTIMKIYKDYVEVNGKQAVWDFFHHNGGAAVIPVTRDGKILMVRQYRNAIDRFTLEIPAGAFDTSAESGDVCVARELEEETGYKAGSVEWLITIRSMVAFCNEKVEIFVAKDLIPSKQNLDEDEFVEIIEVSLQEALSMIHDGRIVDGKTIAALSYVALAQ